MLSGTFVTTENGLQPESRDNNQGMSHLQRRVRDRCIIEGTHFKPPLCSEWSNQMRQNVFLVKMPGVRKGWTLYGIAKSIWRHDASYVQASWQRSKHVKCPFNLWPKVPDNEELIWNGQSAHRRQKLFIACLSSLHSFRTFLISNTKKLLMLPFNMNKNPTWRKSNVVQVFSKKKKSKLLTVIVSNIFWFQLNHVSLNK